MSGLRSPADLAPRRARVIYIAAGSDLHRFWTLREGAKRHKPIYYDRSLKGRLNAPEAGYGVLSAAEKSYGAFAETFVRKPECRTGGSKLLANKAYARLRRLRPLRTNEWATS